MPKRHILPMRPLEPGELGWEPPEPILRVLRELVVRGHAPHLRAAAEGLMTLALPSVEARLQLETAPPPATENAAPGAAGDVDNTPTVPASPDPLTLGSFTPAVIGEKKRGVKIVAISPRPRRLVAGQQKRTEHLNFSGPGEADAGTAPAPPLLEPGLQEPALNQASAPRVVAGMEGSEFGGLVKHAPNRAQDAPGGVLRGGDGSWEGRLSKNVLERLLLLRTHPSWPTDNLGPVWKRALVDRGVMARWNEGNLLWRATTEHSQQSLAGAFQVSFARNVIRYPFVATDGVVYPEIVYKAWLWCPADASGLLVGW